MTKEKIEKCLTKALYDMATSKGMQVSYMNSPYSIEVGKAYIQQWFIDASPTDTTLAEGVERHVGIMQLDVNVPSGNGNKLMYEYMENIFNVFKTNGKINNEQGNVRLQKVYARGHNLTPPWYTRYITIEYTAFSDS